MLDYRNISDLHFLIKEIRNNLYSTKTYKLITGPGVTIEDRAPHCLLNAMIAATLDTYNVFDRRDDFVLFESYHKGEPHKYMTRVLKHLMDMNIPYDVEVIPHIMAHIKGCFTFLSMIVDNISFLDHSLDDYIDGYENHQEFRDILDNPPLTDDMNPYEAAKILTKLPEIFEKQVYIKPISNLLISGVKVNKQQIMQNLQWGLVPDVLNPRIMSRYLVTEGCLSGYRKHGTYSVDAKVSRLVVLSTNDEVKTVGYLSKLIGAAVQYMSLNEVGTRETLEDCGSTRYVTITINSKKDLAYNKYSNFILPNGKFDYIDTDREDLVGKTLQIRSMMLCNRPIHICDRCFGHNARFNRDTTVTKFNFGVSVLEETSKKLQGVISIKHAISGKLEDILISYSDISNVHINDFMKLDLNLFKRLEYNKLIINDKDFVVNVTKLGDKYNLYVDGIEVELHNSYIQEDLGSNKKGEYAVIITLPNESVLTYADDMEIALNKHSKDAAFSFDWREGKTVDQQIQYVFEYLERKMGFSHRRYTEALVGSLVRDDDKPNLKPSPDSRAIRFLTLKQNISGRDSFRGLSSSIPYGYFKQSLNNIINDGETPKSEYDILYNVNKEDVSRTSAYLTMTNKLATSLNKFIDTNKK